MHRDIKDFLDSPIIDASYRYMETLQHTPIFVVGVNFNITISQYQENSIIKKIFNEPTTGLQKTSESTTDYQVDLKAMVSNSEKETLSVKTSRLIIYECFKKTFWNKRCKRTS